jgi:hypothetical protein
MPPLRGWLLCGSVRQTRRRLTSPSAFPAYSLQMRMTELLSLLAEMLPTLGLELDTDPVIVPQHHIFPSLNMSD